jgi:diaminopimelate epimerase
MQLSFYKYQGTGNDFIILDNRAKNIELTEEEIRFLCNRNFGIGADGLMLLQTLENFDFEMVYFNADGKPSTMCGNGGRCLTQFAKHLGIHADEYKFMAIDGEHLAQFGDNGWVHLKMKNVTAVTNHFGDFVLDTGSPHFVRPVSNVITIDVFNEGKAIRNSKDFVEAGINVNFVEQTGEDDIYVRTYERGVENETLSCGTGVTASALVFYHNENGYNRIEVTTPGGQLAVEFDKVGDAQFENIWLCGPATFVFKGEIEI